VLPSSVFCRPQESLEEIAPLKLADLEALSFEKGFGDNDSMLLSQDGVLKDRELLKKLLLLGRNDIKMSKVVDAYHVVQKDGGKRRKTRPTQGRVPWQCLV